MHRFERTLLSKEELDAVYARLAGEEFFATRAAQARAIQGHFSGWMCTKGAEASGADPADMRRALTTLNEYPLCRKPFRAVGNHPVSRNEFICQRAVGRHVRMGAIPWSEERNGKHLHRNGRRLPPLTAQHSAKSAALGALAAADLAHTPRDEPLGELAVMSEPGATPDAGHELGHGRHRATSSVSAAELQRQSAPFSPVEDPEEACREHRKELRNETAQAILRGGIDAIASSSADE